MRIRDSIFGSGGEEHGYRKIERTWDEKYMVAGQTALSALLEPDDRWRGDTSPFFFKTSVDYVLCTAAGQPLVAIDFDGMGEGFSAPDERMYVPYKDQTRIRKRKFDIKLRHTRESGLPYYIVGSEEFKDLGADVCLTIVDGIIGMTVARQAFKQYYAEGETPGFPELAGREGWEEPYAMELECNPVMRQQGVLQEAISKFSGDLTLCTYRDFEEPALPSGGRALSRLMGYSDREE